MFPIHWQIAVSMAIHRNYLLDRNFKALLPIDDAWPELGQMSKRYRMAAWQCTYENIGMVFPTSQPIQVSVSTEVQEEEQYTTVTIMPKIRL